MQDDASSSSSLPQQLPIALQLHILSFLAPNEIALSGRLVSPDLAQALRVTQHFTASLSQPLPPHAAPWAVEAGQQHVRQLPFRYKPRLLCTAAASGSEVNLEVALALLQPSVFPEVLQEHGKSWRKFHAITCLHDPGEAAVSAGHPQLLGWLLHHCPSLLCASNVLVAAAQHCSLAGLQAAWEMLHTRLETVSLGSNDDFQELLDAAAESVTLDAVNKMEWLLEVGRGRCRLETGTAEAAARSGDLGRLRWLRYRGCPIKQLALKSALLHADLAVAQWLVDEAGCKLPVPQNTDVGYWKESLQTAAASAPDAVAKLQWLWGQGVPPPSAAELPGIILAAVRAGQVEALRHLLSVCRTSLGQLVAAGRLDSVCEAAIRSGSLSMLEYLRLEGVGLAGWPYPCDESIALMRWLVREAHVPVDGAQLLHTMRMWPARDRELLQAVQLLVGEAGCRDWDAGGLLHYAALWGELAPVQYLLQHMPGHRPEWIDLKDAANGGCEALLEWLVEQHPGCMEGAGGGAPYIEACRVGDLGTLTALRRLGVPWGTADMLLQAVQGFLETPVLHWLVEQGAPVGRNNRKDRRRAAAFLRNRHLDPTIAAVLQAWAGQRRGR